MGFFAAGLLVLVVCEFFYKTKSVTGKANLHTRAASESLPEQSSGLMPMLSMAPSASQAEQLSYSHHHWARPSSAVQVINTCSDSHRAFHLQVRKAQPSSTSALHAHLLTAQVFHPFPPLPVELVLFHCPVSPLPPGSGQHAAAMPMPCFTPSDLAPSGSYAEQQSPAMASDSRSCRCVPTARPGKSGSITVRLRSS